VRRQADGTWRFAIDDPFGRGWARPPRCHPARGRRLLDRLRAIVLAARRRQEPGLPAL